VVAPVDLDEFAEAGASAPRRMNARGPVNLGETRHFHLGPTRELRAIGDL
jgi:hypothetical protein